MATITQRHPRIRHGGEDHPATVLVKAANTIVYGQMVINSSGEGAKAGNDPANIMGIAKEAAAAAATLEYTGIVADTIIEIQCNSTTARSMLGESYSAVQGTDTNMVLLDKSDTTNEIFLVVGFLCDYSNDEAIGDTYGTLLCKVREAYLVG